MLAPTLFGSLWRIPVRCTTYASEPLCATLRDHAQLMAISSNCSIYLYQTVTQLLPKEDQTPRMLLVKALYISRRHSVRSNNSILTGPLTALRRCKSRLALVLHPCPSIGCQKILHHPDACSLQTWAWWKKGIKEKRKEKRRPALALSPYLRGFNLAWVEEGCTPCFFQGRGVYVPFAFTSSLPMQLVFFFFVFPRFPRVVEYTRVVLNTCRAGCFWDLTRHIKP